MLNTEKVKIEEIKKESKKFENSKPINFSFNQGKRH